MQGAVQGALEGRIGGARVWRQAALDALGPQWRSWLARESVHQESLIQALTEAATSRVGPGGRVVVPGMDSASQALCGSLREAGLQVAVDPGTARLDAAELFGCEVVRAGAPGLRVDSRVEARREHPGESVHPDQPSVWSDYEARLRRHGAQFAARMDGLTAGDTVLFVAKKAYFNQLRVSAALRRQGWRTVAVVLDTAMRGHNEGYFDEVISTDLCTLLCWLSGTQRALLHTQGWLFRYHIPTLIDAFKPPGAKQVVELMDLHAFMFPEANLPEALPHMREVWGPDVEATHDMQRRCEQYLLDHADAVLFPGDERMQQALGFDMETDHDRGLNFMCYPAPEFFAEQEGSGAAVASGDLRLAFAGGVVTSDRNPSLFSDAQMLSTFRPLLQDGLRIQVFNNPMIVRPETYRHAYAEHLALQEQYPRYRFGLGSGPPAITEQLAGFDYGLMVYDTSGVLIGEDHFRLLVPTKFFLYLEAGLPVLISERWHGVARFVEQHGIGHVVTEQQRADLPALLDRLDHVALRRNVLEARQALSMDRQVPRLVAVYERLLRA